MSILASLAKAYDRLPNAPPFGFSSEKIGFLISLNADGTVADVFDLRTGDGKKKQPTFLQVPQAEKRTVGIAPNFLWDKTAYVLGVTAGDGKRTSKEHDAFKQRHLEVLSGTEDSGLLAFLAFLKSWTPQSFVAPLWPEEMKDQNVVFALEEERRRDIFLHNRSAAKALWAKKATAGEGEKNICLVTGESAVVSRLHPSIKGVWGAQSSGASIVSFNLDSFTSYGHEQGDNAPVSEAAAFAYTTALNRFLEKGSQNRIQIGDASTVFWADASDMNVAVDAESLFAAIAGDEVAAEKDASRDVGLELARIRKGEPLEVVAPRLANGVRFHVLGLAPNAARLSIRFYFENDFGVLAKNYARYVEDMRIAPPARDEYPPLWKYLLETATQGKSDNVLPTLAGEWMRAILTGTHYPLTLLATMLMRLRADKDVNALRVSILKSILIRNFNRRVPVALDLENPDKGYLLGRLFAVYEHVQRAALGDKVNATIKDKFYGAASAQPRKVFALLEKGSANHLSKVGKQKPGLRVTLEKDIGSIMAAFNPGDDPFPTSLSAQEQALFGVGYYHQRNEFFKSKTAQATSTGDDAS